MMSQIRSSYHPSVECGTLSFPLYTLIRIGEYVGFSTNRPASESDAARAERDIAKDDLFVVDCFAEENMSAVEVRQWDGDHEDSAFRFGG